MVDKIRFSSSFIIILLVLSLQFVGCKNTVEESFFAAINSISKDEVPGQTHVYLLIPNSGCSGCIHTAQQFLYDNIERFNDLKFIIHRFDTKKELKIEFGNKIYNHGNFIVDYNHEFFKNGFTSIYPVAFIVNENKLEETITIKPENGSKIYDKLTLLLKGNDKTFFTPKFNLTENKEIEFDIKESGSIDPTTVQIFEDKKNILFTYIIDNILYFYEYGSKKFVKKIFFEINKFDFIGAYKIKSIDSIYIYAYFKRNIFLVDQNSNIIDSVSIESYCKRSPIDPSGTTLTPMQIIDGNVYLTSNPRKNLTFNLALFCNLRQNKVSGKFKTDIYEKYKMPLISDYYNIYSTVNLNKKQFVYSFPLKDDIYVFEKNNNVPKKYYAGSNSIKKFDIYIDDYQNDAKSLNFYAKNPNYFSILYDKYRNCYYRFAYLPIDTTKSYKGEELIFKKPLTVVILDENFKKIGETLLSRDNYLPHIAFITKEGLNIIKYEKSQNNNKMIFGVLSLEEI